MVPEMCQVSTKAWFLGKGSDRFVDTHVALLVAAVNHWTFHQIWPQNPSTKQAFQASPHLPKINRIEGTYLLLGATSYASPSSVFFLNNRNVRSSIMSNRILLQPWPADHWGGIILVEGTVPRDQSTKFFGIRVWHYLHDQLFPHDIPSNPTSFHHYSSICREIRCDGSARRWSSMSKKLPARFATIPWRPRSCDKYPPAVGQH